MVAQCSGILDKVGSKDRVNLGLRHRLRREIFFHYAVISRGLSEMPQFRSLNPPNLGVLDSCVHSSIKEKHWREPWAGSLKTWDQSLPL